MYDISSDLVWSINNEFSEKKYTFYKNSISLNGFSWETFFFFKKNLGDWVSQKLIYNFYKSCKKIKVESKLVYGIITTDEKKNIPQV